MDTEKNATVTTTDEESTVTGESTTTVHYHVGHNDAGYLPEADVSTVASWEEAREILVDDMRRAADSLETWADEHDCDDIPCPTYGDECAWQNAQNARNEAEDLESAQGPEFLTYLSDGRPLPVAWWITVCSETNCEIDD